MPKGQDLSHHQRKIVNRYYEHRDTIMTGKLSELATELFLCTDPKKAAKLWASVELAVAKTAAAPSRVKKMLEKKDVQELARLANELAVG